MFFWDNIAQDEVVAFLHEVLHHLRGHVIALLDNSNTHQGAPLRDLCKRFPRLHLEHFPPYAPDLNPVETLWSNLKGQELANRCADGLGEADGAVRQGMARVRQSQQLAFAFLHHAGLSF